MKKIKIDFKNKKTWWAVIGLLVLLLLAFFFYRSLQGKSLKVWNNNKDYSRFDVADTKDYSKYENKVSANFEGDHVLNFSFLNKNDVKVEQGKGSQARWFKLLNASGTNDVTLYFTYEGGRGYSADDYIKEVLNKDNDLKIQDVKFADEDTSNIKYVLDEKNNAEYYVETIKIEGKDPWLAIVENLNAKDETSATVAKDLIRSFEVK